MTHPINFGAQLVARASGRPWASVALSPVSLFSATDPPVFSEPPFEETLAGFWPSFQRVLLRRADLGLSRWLAPYRKIESELGLSPAPAGARASAAGLAGEHGGDRLPVPRARERALTRDPAIPGRRRAADRVHAGIRAVGYAGDFYEHSLDAVARLGRRALLLIGRDPANQPRRTLPPTVLAVHYAPHSAVFPRAAVIVHQGGIGTTGEAMGAGRPMLVVPFGQDRPDHARRLKRLGWPVAFPPSATTPAGRPGSSTSCCVTGTASIARAQWPSASGPRPACAPPSTPSSAWSYEGGAGAGSCRKVVIRVSTTSGRVKGRKWSAPGTIAS